MNRTVEEIRTEALMTQKQFAEHLGISVRTYLDRLNGTTPKWTIEEIIKASKLNGGEIIVEASDGIYDVHVQKVG